MPAAVFLVALFAGRGKLKLVSSLRRIADDNCQSSFTDVCKTSVNMHSAFGQSTSHPINCGVPSGASEKRTTSDDK